jgi:hypothetical protein
MMIVFSISIVLTYVRTMVYSPHISFEKGIGGVESFCRLFLGKGENISD